MKKFVSAVVISFLCLALFQLANFQLLVPFLTKRHLQQVPCAETLIAGDSHGERVWVPNSVNFSRGGDPLSLQLATIQAVLDERPDCNIKRVLISVGPQNFSELPTQRLSGEHEEGRWLDGNFRRMVALNMKFDEKPIQLLHVLRLQFFEEQTFLSFREPVLDSLTVLSAYQTQHRLSLHLVTSERWFKEHERTTGELQSHVRHWNKNHRLNIYLIGTPLHQNYRSRIGECGYSDYKKFMRSLESPNGIHYIELEETMLPDSFFFDADHLRNWGALWLTDTLEVILAQENS